MPSITKYETKEMFQYIASLLDELIMNKGEVINITTPIEFQIEKIKKNLITVLDQPIQINGLVKRINKKIDKTRMESFKQSILTEWLFQNGYLNKDKRTVLQDINDCEAIYAVEVEDDEDDDYYMNNVTVLIKNVKEKYFIKLYTDCIYPDNNVLFTKVSLSELEIQETQLQKQGYIELKYCAWEDKD